MGDDSTKEPCDDDESADVTDAPAADIALRRNLGRGRRGRRRGDVTKEPLADGETREPRQTREPRDTTKEPCEDGEDCQRRPRRRRDDDSTKEPCDDDEATESTEGAIPALRRLLRGGNRATREPLADGQTREPRDVTKEPCGRGRRDSDSKTPLMNQQLKLQFFDVHYERVDVVGRILMLRSQTESLRLLALRVLSFLEKSMRLWNPFL